MDSPDLNNDIQIIANDLYESIELYIKKEKEFIELFCEYIPFLCIVIDKRNPISFENNIIFTSFTNAAIYRKFIYKNSRYSKIISFKNTMTPDSIKKYKFDSFVYYDKHNIYGEQLLKLINFKLIDDYPFKEPFEELNSIFNMIDHYTNILKHYVNLYYPHIYIVQSSRKDIRTGQIIISNLGVYSSFERASVKEVEVRLKHTSARLDSPPELLREYFDEYFIKKCETALYDDILYCIDDIHTPFEKLEKVERLSCLEGTE